MADQGCEYAEYREDTCARRRAERLGLEQLDETWEENRGDRVDLGVVILSNSTTYLHVPTWISIQDIPRIVNQ